jgi:hypothetical protein
VLSANETCDGSIWRDRGKEEGAQKMISGQTGRRRSWRESRVARILTFVAITWTIAGVFILMQEGIPTLVDVMVGKGWIPDRLVMPASPRAEDCRAAVERARSSPPDPAVAAHARLLVWRLGFHTGVAAGIASAAAGSPQPVDSVALLALPQQVSQVIGVEPPTLPTIQHAANALYEFQVFVDADPHCIAAQIGDKYSPRQAALYKFALIAGHAAVYRIKAPTSGAQLASAIRVHGSQAAIPPELWQPLVEPSIESLPGADPAQKISFWVSRVEEHLKENP